MDPRVLIVAAVLAAGLLAQQAPQQPTFRTRAELVRLDVTVLDRNGKPLPFWVPAYLADGDALDVQTFVRRSAIASGSLRWWRVNHHADVSPTGRAV